jgi:hypothetical protein
VALVADMVVRKAWLSFSLLLWLFSFFMNFVSDGRWSKRKTASSRIDLQSEERVPYREVYQVQLIFLFLSSNIPVHLSSRSATLLAVSN